METKKLIQKIFGLLNSSDYEIIMTNLKGPKLGEIIPDKDIIKISPLCRLRAVDGASASPAATLVHEILHIIYPDRQHKAIQKMTREVWRSLSPLQKLALYEHLFENR